MLIACWGMPRSAHHALTTLGVGELRAHLRAIEAANGRERAGPRFAPRTLDLDLLTYGDEVGEIDGVPFLAYELIEDSRTLGDVLHTAPLEQRVRWVRDAARAAVVDERLGLLGRDRLEILPSGLVRSVERVGLFGLCQANPRPLRDQARLVRPVRRRATWRPENAA